MTITIELKRKLLPNIPGAQQTHVARLEVSVCTKVQVDDSYSLRSYAFVILGVIVPKIVF